MQFKSTAATVLALAGLVPFVVPPAQAQDFSTQTTKTTTTYSTIRPVRAKVRTVYRTATVPVTVYRKKLIPVRQTVYRTAYAHPRTTRTTVTRTTHTTAFLPTDALIVPTTTVVRSTAVAPALVAPQIITTAPDFAAPGTVVYKEHHRKVRVSTLEPEVWY